MVRFLDVILLGYVGASVVVHLGVFTAWVYGYKLRWISNGVLAVGVFMVSIAVADINTHVFGFTESPAARLAALVLACITYVVTPPFATFTIVYVFAERFRSSLRELPWS